MYNKKVLNQATANLNKAKAPVKKSDRIINSNKLLPFISSEGFKQGPPPPGTNYRIPGNTIYNPTPYNIKAVGSNGEQKFIAAGDTTKRTFKDAQYVDEYQMKRGGTPPSLPKKKNSKGYSRSITATNKLFAQNPLTKKKKLKKKKIFDPNSRYYQNGGDISIPELIKAQEGLQQPIIDKAQDEAETVVYGNEYDKKRQLLLMDQLRIAKGAYQDWRDEAGLRKAQLKNEDASSIDSLKARASDYKKLLEEEKKTYDKAGRALNILKKQRPDEWKDAKIKDVLSGKGIESLRSLYSEGKLSEGDFRYFYNNFGSQYDPNVQEGSGPGKQYSANEARQNWMENVPEFVDKVSTFAAAAALTPAMLALAPVSAAPGILGRGAGALGRFVPKAARPFLQATKTAYNNPWIKALPGSSTRNILASGWTADTLMDVPEVVKSIGQGFKGEKEWLDVGADVGAFGIDLLTADALKGTKGIANSLKDDAAKVVKFLDKPLSQYKKNPVYGPLPITNFDKFNRSRFNPLGRLPKISEIRPSDALRAQTVLTTLYNIKDTYNDVAKDYMSAADSNLTPAERSAALANGLKNTLTTGLSLTPLTRWTAPLYSTNFANATFMLDNAYKAAQGNPTGGRAILNASRLITKQKGGVTNSYEKILSQNKINELIKQGYKIEYLD
jgi:hypothetical protein